MTPDVAPGAFREAVFLDFEFRAGAGERPAPVCYVAVEQRSGRVFHRWLDGKSPKCPPFAHGRDVVTVAYFASAEWSCYLALGWPLPDHVVDIYAEFRNLTNGMRVPAGKGLRGALVWFGLDAIEGAEKDFMRKRIMAGGPWSNVERKQILDYCESDVRALQRLWPKLFDPDADLRPALLRGRFTKAVAHAEHNGVPVDGDQYRQMADHWPELQQKIIDRIDIPVFDGRVFKAARFADWVEAQHFDWPRLPSGALAVDDDSFRDMAARYPAVEPLRQVRQMLGQLRKPDLAVGPDSRNRTLLSPFATLTGRNAPSNSKFIFGLPSWMRGLIRPEPGRALAYVDWSQQEFAIAAALSGDSAMQNAYLSGDPYLEFARLSGVVPPSATKESHPVERRLFKTVTLGTQYQLGPAGLAYRLGASLPEAEELLDHHKRVFSRFWAWSEAACDYAQLHGRIHSTFGWTYHTSPETKLRTIRNFPMQANGAECLRLACSIATESGVHLAAPIHDALLIESAEGEIEDATATTRRAMQQASDTVLNGFPIRTDVQTIRYPHRFFDERGKEMWKLIESSLLVLLVFIFLWSLYIRDPPPFFTGPTPTPTIPHLKVSGMYPPPLFRK